MTTTASISQRIARYLFGFDVFISYSRADAAAYAIGLARELSARGFSCWLDQLESWPGRFLESADAAESLAPPHIEKQLVRSSMLILVSTAGAFSSAAITIEVRTFLTAHRSTPEGRSIAVIDLDLELRKSRAEPGSKSAPIWNELVAGLVPLLEEADRPGDGPSHQILSRLIDSVEFDRRSARQRRATLATALFLVVAFVSTILLTFYAREAGNDARAAHQSLTRVQKQIKEASAREAKAASTARSAELQATSAELQATKARSEAALAQGAARTAAAETARSVQLAQQAARRASEARASQREADTARIAAEHSATTARAQELAATQARDRSLAEARANASATESRLVRRLDPTRALRMAALAVRTAPTPESVSALRYHLSVYAVTKHPLREEVTPRNEVFRCLAQDLAFTTTLEGVLSVRRPFTGQLLARFDAGAENVACGGETAFVWGRGADASLWHARRPDRLMPLDPQPPERLAYGVVTGEGGVLIGDDQGVAAYDSNAKMRSLYRAPSRDILRNALPLAHGKQAIVLYHERLPEKVYASGKLPEKMQRGLLQLDMREQTARVLDSVEVEADSDRVLDEKLLLNRDERFVAAIGELWRLNPIKSTSILGSSSELALALAGSIVVGVGDRYVTGYDLHGSKPTSAFFSSLTPSATRELAFTIGDSTNVAIGMTTDTGVELVDPRTGVVLVDLPHFERWGSLAIDKMSVFTTRGAWDLSGKIGVSRTLPGFSFAGTMRGEALTPDGEALIADYARHEPSVPPRDAGLFVWRLRGPQSGKMRIPLSRDKPPWGGLTITPCSGGDCVAILEIETGILRLVHSDFSVESWPLLNVNGTCPFCGFEDVSALAASANGSVVVVAHSRRLTLEVWRDHGKSLSLLNLPSDYGGLDDVRRLSLTSTGDTLAISDWFQTVLVDSATGRVVSERVAMVGGQFDRGGDQFVGHSSAGPSALTRLSRGESGWELDSRGGFLGVPQQDELISWSPNGRFVLMANASQVALGNFIALRVWDAARGTVAWERLSRSDGKVVSAVFTDDKTILSYWSNGAIRVDKCDVCVGVDELLALADRKLEESGEPPSTDGDSSPLATFK